MAVHASIESQERVAAQLFENAGSENMLPDIGLHHSIIKFSGLDSASALESYSAQLLRDLSSKGPAFLKDLGAALSAFTHVPAGVGLGALVLSFILDLSINKGKGRDDTADLVRSVFAEEKASGVRDSIDEYIKRFHFNMNNPEELLKDTERMEAQLSNGLTRLRNSMLIDNQMSSRSMKHWVNGAAFDLLMLIHIARMKVKKSLGSNAELNRQVESIRSIADHYGNELQKLLAKYKTYKRSTIDIVHTKYTSIPSIPRPVRVPENCGVKDKELGKESLGVKWGVFACDYLADPYVNHMFNHWKVIEELRGYFPGVKQNLKEKIMQNSEFNIQKFLP